MRFLILMLVFLLVFVGMATFELQRRGLLTRENLDRLIEARAKAVEPELPPAEPVGLAAALSDQKQELREEAEGLRRLNERLESQRRELEEQRRLIEKQIKQLKTEAAAAGAAGQGLASDRISEEMALLVKMYEGMDPDQAAAILENMPEPITARVLLQMRGRQAAQVMGALQSEKAAEISRLLADEKRVEMVPKPETVETP